jgi:hypothetical protein
MTTSPTRITVHLCSDCGDDIPDDEAWDEHLAHGCGPEIHLETRFDYTGRLILASFQPALDDGL